MPPGGEIRIDKMDTTHINPMAYGLTNKLSTAAARARMPALAKHTKDWLSAWLPKQIGLGRGSCGRVPQYFEAGEDYVIPSETNSEGAMLEVTLVEEFARAGGHVIWIGTTSDLSRMSEQLMFKIAGLELFTEGTQVKLNVIEHLKLIDARAAMINMWIDFCNVEDCGDAVLEQEFVASTSSFKPTLIVVDASIFDESASDPFEFLIRNTFGLHMVEQLRSANPASSVLWPSTVSGSVIAVQK